MFHTKILSMCCSKYWIYGSKLSLNGHNTTDYNTETAVIGGDV